MSTTKYGVAIAGVSCAFAKSWVARLVGKHTVIKNNSYGQRVATIPGGPSGFVCNAYDDYAKALPTRAFSGVCGALGAPKKFAWNPQ